MDDMRGDIVNCRCDAQEVACDGLGDVHACTLGLKVVRIPLSVEALRSNVIAHFDIVAPCLRAHMDEVVTALLPAGLLDRDDILVLLKALHGTRRASHL